MNANADALFSLTPPDIAPAYLRRLQRSLTRTDIPMSFEQLTHERGKLSVSPGQVMEFDCEEPEANETELDAMEKARPSTRADCKDVPRPCPFVSCRHHVFLSVTMTGGIVYHHRSPWDLPPDRSCALDMAELEGMPQEEVAAALGYRDRQGVAACEELAIEKMRKKLRRLTIAY